MSTQNERTYQVLAELSSIHDLLRIRKKPLAWAFSVVLPQDAERKEDGPETAILPSKTTIIEAGQTNPARTVIVDLRPYRLMGKALSSAS